MTFHLPLRRFVPIPRRSCAAAHIQGAGPALELRVRGGPPLRVNSGAKVANLNADRLDCQDAAAFLPANGTAANSDKLDGQEAAAFQPRLLWAEVDDDGTILRGRGAVSVLRAGGGYLIEFSQDIEACAFLAIVGKRNAAYNPPGEIQTTLGTGSPIANDIYVPSSTDSGATAKGLTVAGIC